MMTDVNRDALRAHLGMLLWALIVGSSFPNVGLMSKGLPPLLLTAIRFIIASVALLPLIWRAPDRWPGLPGFALYAVLGLCQVAFFGAMFWAAHRTTALSMAVLYVGGPLMAYCLGLAFKVERAELRLLGILALGALGALGLAWAESGGGLDGLRLGFPEAVFFLGCLASALYPVLSKWGLARRWLSEWAALRTFWTLAVGAVLVAALGLLEETPRALAPMTLADAALLVYLAVFSSGVTFWLIQRATAALTPAAATAYTYLTPFVSMLLLFVAEPRRISWHWLPGSLMVVLSIWLLLRRRGGRTKPRVADSAPTGKPAHGSG
jgi:drug/metabolite transporter (DMT)-like permease